MAVVAPSSPEAQEPRAPKSDQENPPSTSQDASPLPPSGASAPPPAAAPENPSPAPTFPSNSTVVTPPPPSVPSFTPSFRPVGAPAVPQFTPVPNPSLVTPAYQNPGLQPPGVCAPSGSMVPGTSPGTGPMPVSMQQLQPPGVYPAAPGQMPPSAPGSYVQTHNGYMTVSTPMQQAPSHISPLGIPRYPAPYPTIVRPGFPPRPLGPPFGIIPTLPRPPIQGIRGVPPIMPPVVRPAVPATAPTEKPQTTVYVGKIASTVDNEFIESILRLCGPVKSWKRAENPTDGTFKGFGFCEFESAEGVLRALRLLNKLNIDGQELMLNVTQANREYLERYVEKKTEREKLKESEVKASEKENGSPAVEKHEPPSSVDAKSEDNDEPMNKEKQENTQTFGVVNDEDRDADKEAMEKLGNMIEERLKNKPLPPPTTVDSASNLSKSNSEVPSKSKDGDSDVDIMKNDAAEDKKDEEMMSEARATADHDRSETSSSDRVRRRERSRERERGRDLKREKERELERFERDRERERVRRERDREMKIREAERLFKEHLKEWEVREREKESHRQREIEREKDRARERRREIKEQENESDEDDTRKRRHRSNALEERRRKRQREKEDDTADRLREQEETEEARLRLIAEQKQKEEEFNSTEVLREKVALVPDEDIHAEDINCPAEQFHEDDTHAKNGDDEGLQNDNDIEMQRDLATAPDVKQGSNILSRKLGFGLMPSGKRAAVPSVFHEEDDEDLDKEKKMRPLVPIDYSTEELQAVQSSTSGTPPNLIAAAEFAKRITSISTKEEKSDSERERSRRASERPSHKDRKREDEEYTRTRDDHREKSHDRISHRSGDQDDKLKTTENKKLLDAKQLIDMIPKTKEKLFAYEINWDIYDKHDLHERMRPWISKKITEFLGEEEATLVDYIVTSTRDHVPASHMLDLLQSILDDEAEMFVLKMWRMLIFEIKKVETGLNLKSRS